jgi:hypothetical protein
MKVLLGGFNAKLGRDNIFEPTIGYESLHQDSNDNGVRRVNFAPKHSSIHLDVSWWEDSKLDSSYVDR